MGSIALASPYGSLTSQLLAANKGVASFGAPPVAYKYTGPLFDFAQSDANGGAHAFSFTGVPADAVALECWVNANSATDYLFWRHVGGLLSATGVLATASAANVAGQGRWVNSGQHAIIPFLTVGAVPASLRFAFNTASGSRLQGRYISQAAQFPYLLASLTEDAITGAGAQVQLTYGSSTRYPSGYCGVIMQIYGGPARVTLDGTAASATVGDMWPAGTYLIDFDKHGISITALRIYLPVGTNILANSLVYA